MPQTIASSLILSHISIFVFILVRARPRSPTPRFPRHKDKPGAEGARPTRGRSLARSRCRAGDGDGRDSQTGPSNDTHKRKYHSTRARSRPSVHVSASISIDSDDSVECCTRFIRCPCIVHSIQDRQRSSQSCAPCQLSASPSTLGACWDSLACQLSFCGHCGAADIGCQPPLSPHSNSSRLQLCCVERRDSPPAQLCQEARRLTSEHAIDAVRSELEGCR